MTEISLPLAIVDRLLELARSSPEREVCGLLARRGRLVRCCPVDNVAEDPARFFYLDERQQIDAFRAMRDNAEELFAIYHSHPRGPSTPSATDLRQAQYPDTLYLILAPQEDGAWGLRGFCLRDGAAREVELEIR
jgi:proteasome lid subunit RPN8/RPN11